MTKYHFSLSLIIAAITFYGHSFTIAKPPVVKRITITADKTQFKYDVKEFTVKSGQRVEITFKNPIDSKNKQKHNILILKPGTKNAVGALADAATSDNNFILKKKCIPRSKDILFKSKLLNPGQRDVIVFNVPSEPGDYPYICTYPGHWVLMNGVMKVK